MMSAPGVDAFMLANEASEVEGTSNDEALVLSHESSSAAVKAARMEARLR